VSLQQERLPVFLWFWLHFQGNSRCLRNVSFSFRCASRNQAPWAWREKQRQVWWSCVSCVSTKHPQLPRIRPSISMILHENNEILEHILYRLCYKMNYEIRKYVWLALDATFFHFASKFCYMLHPSWWAMRAIPHVQTVLVDSV
jgi:hypothetical protein